MANETAGNLPAKTRLRLTMLPERPMQGTPHHPPRRLARAGMHALRWLRTVSLPRTERRAGPLMIEDRAPRKTQPT